MLALNKGINNCNVWNWFYILAAVFLAYNLNKRPVSWRKHHSNKTRVCLLEFHRNVNWGQGKKFMKRRGLNYRPCMGECFLAGGVLLLALIGPKLGRYLESVSVGDLFPLKAVLDVGEALS